MNLLIVGATGHAGRLVTQQALQRGHLVTAFVRTPFLPVHENLTSVTGDPRLLDDLRAALPGHHAIISCLGNPSPDNQWLVRDAAKATVEVLVQSPVKRFVVLSGGLLFPSFNPIILAMKALIAKKLEDARAMEAVVRASQIDWTIVRPPHLKEGDEAKGYRAQTDSLPGYKWSLQFIDLANFILDAVENQQFIQQVVSVSSA